MCLTKVDEKFRKEDKVEGIGYKVFKQTLNQLVHRGSGLFPEYKGFTPRPTNVWIHERNFRTDRTTYRIASSSGKGEYYPTGWHIFCSRSTAYKYATEKGQKLVLTRTQYTARKVRYRGARVIGTQSRKRILVAKEMFILSRGEKR